MENNEMKKCNCTEPLCCCGRIVERNAISNLGQNYSINQVNFNLQTAAIAIATNGGTAKVSQQSCQTNRNIRDTASIATSCTTLSCNDICENTDLTFSASDQDNQQDVQITVSFFGANVVTANTETVIGRDCADLVNNTNIVRRTIATNCIQVPAAQPENSNQDNINLQLSTSEKYNSALGKTPFSSININGKEIRIPTRAEKRVIEQVAVSSSSGAKDNANKKPVVLNFDKFHVILNLDGISLDVAADPDGNILVDGKEVRR